MFSDEETKSSKTANTSEPVNKVEEVSYETNFDPKINTECGDGTVTISADVDCPDGAIMQVALLSGDLKESYTDKPIVKDKKITSKFKLTNKDVKNYAGMLTFQFNAESISQPDNVKEVFGSKGENLEGNNTKEANFKDGETGKIASVAFTVAYPNKETVKQKMDNLFNQATQQLINASNGLILDIEHPSSGIIHMQVSNNWYLSSANEKQYFAEEMLKTFTSVVKNMDGEDHCMLTIYDESMNEVADSKMFGGMEIEK